MGEVPGLPVDLLAETGADGDGHRLADEERNLLLRRLFLDRVRDAEEAVDLLLPQRLRIPVLADELDHTLDVVDGVQRIFARFHLHQEGAAAILDGAQLAGVLQQHGGRVHRVPGHAVGVVVDEAAQLLLAAIGLLAGHPARHVVARRGDAGLVLFDERAEALRKNQVVDSTAVQYWYAKVISNSSIVSFVPQSRAIAAKSIGNMPTKLYFFNSLPDLPY